MRRHEQSRAGFRIGIENSDEIRFRRRFACRPDPKAGEEYAESREGETILDDENRVRKDEGSWLAASLKNRRRGERESVRGGLRSRREATEKSGRFPARGTVHGNRKSRSARSGERDDDAEPFGERRSREQKPARCDGTNGTSLNNPFGRLETTGIFSEEIRRRKAGFTRRKRAHKRKFASGSAQRGRRPDAEGRSPG